MSQILGRPHLIILSLAAVALLFSGLQPETAEAAQDEPRWTIMVYMAADSEPVLPWEEDINEMEGAQLPDWMNVIALVDPLGVGDSMILEIARDDGVDADIISPEVDDSLEVIPADGEADMASPSTLSDFVTFCSGHYPADRLALVLWGHSGGWYGLCEDGATLLQLPSLGLALEDATYAMGKRVDILITDSCVEGVVETMYEVKDHVDWYVGSEISVPAQGLPYDEVLDSLAEDGAVDPGDWGAQICEIHRTNLMLNTWSASMAVYDLREFDAFVDRLSALSSYMYGYADLYRGTFVETMDAAASSDFMEWYLDAGDVLKRLASAELPLDVRHLALQALAAYDETTYTHEYWASPFDDLYGDVLNYTGSAVYAPSESDLGVTYLALSFIESGWAGATAAIRAAVPETTTGAGPEVSYADTDDDGKADEATLHWPSAHERQVAWVFVETGSGLELLDVLESDGTDIVISGPAGDLTVSASGWDGGVATTHHTLEFVLTHEIDIRVRVFSAESVVTDGVKVIVQTRSGEETLTMSDGEFTGSIVVPDDATYGDLMTVEVVGRGGATVALNHTYVTGQDIVMDITYFSEPDDAVGPELIVPLLAILICGSAVAVYLMRKAKPPGP